ncbi:hypothetical protein E4U17_004489 [Claviceps sp. LM77 group G4]|nr:hypothetical protein E4U17_004489 [Claviceps sp. LM77 group G4]
MSRPLTRQVQTEEVQRLGLAGADFVHVFGGHASEVPGNNAEDWLPAGYASPQRLLPQLRPRRAGPGRLGFQPVGGQWMERLSELDGGACVALVEVHVDMPGIIEIVSSGGDGGGWENDG